MKSVTQEILKLQLQDLAEIQKDIEDYGYAYFTDYIYQTGRTDQVSRAVSTLTDILDELDGEQL